MDDETKEHFAESSFLSAQCALLCDSNFPEVLRVIGPPQANSSFIEDPQETKSSEKRHNDNADHLRPGLCLDHSVQRGTLSVDPEPEGSVSSVEREGSGQGSVSHVPLIDEAKDPTERCDWNEMSGASDFPITGSRDVMCTFLATFARGNGHSTETTTGNLDLDLVRDEQVLHDVSDISRDLRFYGHSVSVLGPL